MIAFFGKINTFISYIYNIINSRYGAVIVRFEVRLFGVRTGRFYCPGKCDRSVLFSPQMNSIGSQPGRRCISCLLLNGMV